MTKESDEDGSFPEAFLLESMRIWQMPLLIGVAWWNALEAGWHRDPMPHHHADHRDEQDNLIVPESIGVEDKQCLFA